MASPVVCENFADFFAAARAFQSQASNKYCAPSKNGDTVNAKPTPEPKPFTRVPSSSDATYTRRGSMSNSSYISATTVESPPSRDSWTYCNGNNKTAPPLSQKTLRVKHRKYMAVTKVKISFEEYVNTRLKPSLSITATCSSSKRQNSYTRASHSPTPSSSRNTFLSVNTEAVPRTTSNNSSNMHPTTDAKILEHPRVHGPSKDISMGMAPEHRVAHTHANATSIDKAPEHPGAHNTAKISLIGKAPEHPVAHIEPKPAQTGKALEDPVAGQKSKLACVSEVSNAKENSDGELATKKGESVKKYNVETTGVTEIWSEVKNEMKERIGATNIADKAVLEGTEFGPSIVSTRATPTDIEIKAQNAYGNMFAKYEVPHNHTTFASNHTIAPTASIGKGPTEVNNNAAIVARNKETKIRFCDRVTTSLPRAKMPTAAIGKKQIEKENNVTKPFEAKNATSKKVTIIHTPSRRRETKAFIFLNGSGGGTSAAIPIISHLAKHSSENALKDDDAVSSESDSDSDASDVVVFRRYQHHVVRPRLCPATPLAATTILPEPNVANRTVPISEYSRIPQGSRSSTPVGNNSKAKSPKTSQNNSQSSNINHREANGPDCNEVQQFNRSYGIHPDSRAVSSGKTSKSPQISQNSPSTRHIRTLAEALSPEYRAMPRAERRALAAKEDEEENRRWKAMTPQEQDEELRALQNAALAEAREGKYTKRARRILNQEEDPAAQMLLARQGPGTDPSSQVFQDIQRRVLAEGKIKPIIYRPELTEMLRDPTEYFYANGSFMKDDFICSAYFPWDDEYYKEYDRKFRGWLDDITKLGYPVDTTSDVFVNGTGHCDGMADAFALDFDDGIVYSLDESDPENARAHETSAGYAYNMTVRKATEGAKNEMRVIISGSVQVLKRKREVHPHAPKGKIYLRVVENKDVVALVNIYNHYTRGERRVLDGDVFTEQDVRGRIMEAENANLPFLVAVEQGTGVWNALNNHSEKIYGFAVASPTGSSTFNRYAAEIQVFVDPWVRRVGTGRCLLDKMLEICDPKYEPKGGYFFDCSPDKRGLYCGRYARYVTRLSYNIHYTDDAAHEYNTYKRWLGKTYGFEESGVLKETAIKEGKPVHTGCLVYKINVEPLGRRRRIEKP